MRSFGYLRPPRPEQFQEKCETVFRPELRENKKIERICGQRKADLL
jgi:hypothetical protein